MTSRTLEVMLDTNGFDDIYLHQCIDSLKKAASDGKLRLYFTHVQRDEIEKIKDDRKHDYILSAIETIPIQMIATAGGVIATDEPIKAGFIGSRVDESRIMSEEDSSLFESLTSQNKKNPMQNTGDLMIAFTAIKENMHYLVTNDVAGFKKPVAVMNTALRGSLRVIDLDRLMQILT